MYEGNGKTKFKTRKEFTGSVLRQMDEAYEFISLNNNLNSTIEGLKRVDNPDYPPYAIREALLNAIVHRDYDYSGSILINIFDDRIEFVSIGGLVKGMTMQDVMGGVSQSRNMVLANIFYRLELIESYGTGIRRIMESYEGRMEQPVFAPAPASFVVILPKITGQSLTDESLSDREKVEKLLEARKKSPGRCGNSCWAAPSSRPIKILNELVAQKVAVKSGSGPAVKYRLA